MDFLLKAAIVVMGCGMLGSVVLGVFYRYVLRSPLAWTHEVATYLLVWSTLLGAFYVHLEDGHVRMTAVVDRLGGRTRQVVLVLSHLAVLLFLAVVFQEGMDFAQRMARIKTPVLRMSMRLPLMAIPVSTALMGLVTLRHLYMAIRYPEKQRPSHEALPESVPGSSQRLDEGAGV